MLHYLINFFYPPRCAACEIRLGSDTLARICHDCLAHIDRMPTAVCAVCGIPMESNDHDIDDAVDANDPADGSAWCTNCRISPPHFSRARACVRYRHADDDESDADDPARLDVVPAIIRRHKYGLDQSLSHALAECLGPELPLGAAHYDVVIPVPLHLARLRWRGFNQAAMLAVTVARRMDLPLDLRTLVRVRETPPQTRQHRSQRIENLRRAFAVRRPARIARRSILLVDDVMTTGATADECARTLLAAGARRVDVLTLARAV
ncbi:MAG TPA: ComF family protein [Candidatus Binataceae bacterium]|jgi:ComF family protein|nr:ComF family protein [Candidatus Binataceae bacterium]